MEETDQNASGTSAILVFSMFLLPQVKFFDQRLVSIYSTADFSIQDLSEPLSIWNQSYPAAYQTLCRGDPITCATSATTFDAVPCPSVIIMDVSNFGTV